MRQSGRMKAWNPTNPPRFNIALRHCNRCVDLSHVAIRKKEGGCWSKVRRTLLTLRLEVTVILIDLNREMQLFLLGYIIISICEIFTVGEFPLPDNVRLVSSWERG